MKKIAVLLAILMSYCCVQSRAQNPYYDALTLKKDLAAGGKFDATKDLEVAAVLKNYLPADIKSNATLVKQVLSYYKDNNPYIAKFIDSARVQSMLAGGGGAITDIQNLISKAGSLDVTTIADGLAKFLVERAKEELSLAFFEKFKEDLDKPEFIDLRILFPRTYETLKLIDTRIYQYSAYLTELRESFITDFKDIGFNIPVALETGTLKQYFLDHPELKTIFSLASQISTFYLQNSGHLPKPGILIEQLDPNHYFGAASPSDKTMNGSIKLLQLVSTSLRSGDTSRYWVRGDSLRMFFSDLTTVRIYLGLLYTSMDTIQFAGGATLKGAMGSLATNFDAQAAPVVTAFNNFSGLIGNFDDYLTYKRGQRNKDSSALFYYTLYTKTMDVVTSGIGLVKVFDPAFNPVFAKFIPAVKSIGDIYINVEQNKFSLAALSVVQLFTNLKDAGYDSKRLQCLSTYAAFMAEVAQAKTSDEVKEIIAQTVLPVGSASIKKNSRFNIAINAYLGGFYGSEKLSDRSGNPWARSAGVSAPIGVTFSWPIKFTKTSYGSISAFGSLFDLGAIASFRLKDTATEKLPKLTLQNIFAPGLGIVFGVPKWPISIGYLYQWGPQLREITATTLDVKQGKLNQRSFVFLAVDIPLLNIFNKPR